MSSNLRVWYTVSCMLAVSASMSGCTMPSMMKQATHLDASASSIVIVGKIELIPPFDANYEQVTHWNVIGEGAIINKIVMATGAEPGSVETGNLVMSQWQDAIEAELGKTFFLKARRQRTWLKGAMMTLDVMTQDRLWFPSSMVFDVPPDAVAVYLGTLRYTRSDFNEIIGVEIIDEYESARNEFRERFGVDAELSRSLLK